MNILFVVNPIAGKKKAMGLIPKIKETMDKTDITYKITTTEKPMEATEITVKGLKEGFDTVVAVGGDGTINEVTNGIVKVGRGTLGVIPGGTGNDLSRTLGISPNVEEALASIIRGKTKSIDIGQANGKMFTNVASMGLDAEIARNTEGLKKFFKGKAAYIASLLKTIISYKTKKLSIVLDDKKIQRDILLIAVGNGRYYGGGMEICPMASIDDGFFHVCTISKINKIKLLFIFPSVFKGKHGKYKKYVEFHKAKSVKIILEEKAYVNVDGEVFEAREEITFDTSNTRIEILI